MSEDFRNCLTQMFNDGAKTGNEADSKKVEHEMKHARNSTQVQLEKELQTDFVNIKMPHLTILSCGLLDRK